VLYILRLTASQYPFGILWPLCCISFGLRLLITPLVSCGHCVVYPSAYGFWITLWYLVAIVLYILRFTASDYPFGILWPLCCISFGLRLLNNPLVSCGHCVVYPSVYRFWLPLWYLVAIVLYILRFTASEYPFGILWPLRCISFGLRLLNTPLVSCGHCVVYPSVYGFWLPLLYLVAIVLFILRFTVSKYPHNGHIIPKGYSEAVNRRIYNTMTSRY
jgi:phosphatidylglycerophosphate synthase